MTNTPKLNLKKDRPDPRDWLYAVKCPEGPAQLPIGHSVDLRPLDSPVMDQGDLGSCTGQSIAGHIQFLELMSERQKTASPFVFELTPEYDPISQLFIYYNERAMEGDVGEDNGAQIRDGIQCIKNNGFCRESLWPYDVSKFALRPSDLAYAEAAKHKAVFHYRLQSIADMQRCLSHGFPFVCGISVFSGFMGSHVAATGQVGMPTAAEYFMGGHAVMIVGYTDQHWIMRNSWGSSWGDQGYCYLPKAYLDPQNNLADDFWTIRLQA